MRVFLTLLIGIFMLLPGACGAFFTFVGLTDANTRPVLMLALPCLALGVGGFFLLRHIWRRKP
jgi:hypothetical protein